MQPIIHPLNRTVWLGCRRRPLISLAAILLAALGLALSAATALAAPAAPVDIPVTQPDGATFSARQWGDEWQNGLETTAGYTILRDEASGYWVYAQERDGALAPALSGARQLVVGRDLPAGLNAHARPAAVERPAGAPGSDLDAPLSLTAPLASSGPLRTPNLGSQPMLFVLVNYTDQTLIYSTAQFREKAFGATGSIAHYYAQASFGALSITPAAESQETANDGVVTVSIAKLHPNDTDDSQTIAADALNAANPYVNFAAYDADGDGYITSAELHLIFVIAGYEESYCGYTCPDSKIWGHSWELSSPLLLDGMYVGDNSADGDPGGYAMFGEIHGDHIAQIGIMVHELGHDLTWPDLYDTDQSSEGVGKWSIMGSGSWNGLTYAGDSPALPDAFLKWYQGWLAPTPSLNGGAYALRQASSYADALLLGSNPGGVDWDFDRTSGAGEYWLVENRQKSGYDAGLPGCGLLIWHIDETVIYWNEANDDEDHPLVDLEQADARRDLNLGINRGDAGDPYPGSSGNTRFNSSSNPAIRFYDSSFSNQDVTITTASCNASMSVSLAPTVQPGVMIAQASGQLDPAGSGPVNFTATFSEPVVGFTDSDISLAGSTAPGTLTAVVSGSGAAYTISVSGMTGSGEVVVSIPAGAAQDVSSNPSDASVSADNIVTYDATPPTLTINQAAGQQDPTWRSTINFTATFSEPVTGFSAGDISFAGSTASGALNAAVSGSGPSYTITVSGMTGSGAVLVSIAAEAAGDRVGNLSGPGTSTDNSVTFDGTSRSFIYLPTIQNVQQIVLSGRVTYLGAPAAGQIVTLQGLNGYAVQDLASTLTSAAGNYSFTPETRPDLYEKYQVVWENPDNSSAMWYWNCNPVSGLLGGSHTCNIEIGDVVMTAPAAGASIHLPATFTWARRATSGEYYTVVFLDTSFEYIDFSYYAYMDASQWTMNSFNNLVYGALSTGTAYYWGVFVENATGYGENYWARKVTFASSGLAPALSGAPAASPHPGGRLDALQQWQPPQR